MAPDWRSPTQDNGATAPRIDLHIALVAATAEMAALLRDRVRVVKPALWKGKRVGLYVIVRPPGFTDDDIAIRQGFVDLGLIDADNAEIGPPDQMMMGYPLGENEDPQ